MDVNKIYSHCGSVNICFYENTRYMTKRYGGKLPHWISVDIRKTMLEDNLRYAIVCLEEDCKHIEYMEGE